MRGLYAAALLGPLIAASQPAAADGPYLVGRQGWTIEDSAQQFALRADLADVNEVKDRTAGLLLIFCDADGYDLFMSFAPGESRRAPRASQDGLMYVFAETAPTGAPPLAVVPVSFQSELTFRSASSSLVDRAGLERFVALLAGAETQFVVLLVPRPETRGFRRDRKLSLILALGATRQERVRMFIEECRRRAG